jgi:hypothetical protein
MAKNCSKKQKPWQRHRRKHTAKNFINWKKNLTAEEAELNNSAETVSKGIYKLYLVLLHNSIAISP